MSTWIFWTGPHPLSPGTDLREQLPNNWLMDKTYYHGSHRLNPRFKKYQKCPKEKTKYQHIEMFITSKQRKMSTISNKLWRHNDEIFQIVSTCSFKPRSPWQLNQVTFLHSQKVSLFRIFNLWQLLKILQRNYHKQLT